METKYTPASIEKDIEKQFSIPLYQRLFEWQESEIIQLLNDLKTASENEVKQPYYIGMLTAYKKSNGFDLVDGQQRFIVLMLLGIYFKWEEFLKIGDNIRLSFFARKNDEKYLKSKIENLNKSTDDGFSRGYTNAKMEAGIKCIKGFVEKIAEDKRIEFENYIRNNLTFFISELPRQYQLRDLNRYFEAMNATGRGLENHEILKVHLLGKLNGNKEHYTRVWNAVSDMDKCLLRQRHDSELIATFRTRQNDALSCLDKNQELFNFCNNSNVKLDNESDLKSIRQISPSKIIPSKQIRSTGERAILSFPEFLLQVLSLQISNEERKETPDFFNVHKLQETFKKSLKLENVELFFKNLLKYRILFDHFIIRISNNDQNYSTYTLAYNDDDAKSYEREKLLKYQAMLYVSTASHIWLSKALSFLAIDASKVDAMSFYNYIVEYDNARIKDENIALKYPEINRYWFWRLDYYLWVKEIQESNNPNGKTIRDYTFRANRSIEHLHAQADGNIWEPESLHSFGNLAMISSGFNSTQSFDKENVKFARIENQINGKFMLESIKLLLMYQKAKENNFNWNKDIAKEHGNVMIDILIESFPNNEDFKNIREKLFNQKII
jgi:hypothetical protein